MGLRSLLGGRGRARADREAAVRLAAVEAAEDDPLFDAELVQERAATLFVAIQRAWSLDDVTTLQRLVGPELMVEWEARLADFRRKGWRNQVDVLDGPEVRYVGVTNRAGDTEDRAVVHLTARLRDVVVDGDGDVLPSDEGEVARISEYWTLGKRTGEWVVVSIEQEREGAHHLSGPLLAVPESDDARLRAEAVMEVAAADTVRADQVGELLSPGFTGTARAAALDLSLVDGRFAPDVLATAVGEVVEAWAQAIDGPDDPLAARATPQALQALLYPTASPRARLVIRGEDLQAMTIVGVTRGTPPEVRLQLDVNGVQYVEDRDTTEVLAGSKRRRTTTRQLWTLRLTDDPRRPWVVVDAAGADL
ncbi:MAG: TIM44-like domain-containing protein [Actinomycetota bacterium]|nr:TIM44-like domain-containing protein [Actinomycetota bacterium]